MATRDRKVDKILPGTGAPTQPDVQRLLDIFGVPEEGDTITWRQWERAAGCDHLSNRGGTILAAWRKRLEEDHAVWMQTIRGKGLEAAAPRDRVRQGDSWIRHGLRRVARASALASRTDRRRLSAEDRRVCESQMFMHAHLTLAARTAPRALSADGLEGLDARKGVVAGDEERESAQEA